MEPLRYVPFSSQIDLHFWHKLSDKKLHELKLSEEPVELRAEYEINLNIKHAVACVSYDAFDVSNESSRGYRISGKLLNMNSIDSFKSCDKKKLLEASMGETITSIRTGAALEDPTQLNKMFLLSYADMKKYFFYYWCAFPSAMVPDSQYRVGSMRTITDEFSLEHLEELTESCGNRAFALIHKSTFEVRPFFDMKNDISETHYILFADPSSSDTNVGWTLRNFLLMVAYYMPKATSNFEVIAVRGSSRTFFDKSKIFTVRLHKISFDEPGLTYVGYEKNEKDQYGPRLANLAHCFDPLVLAQNAVDLNLKLMKWRLAPDLKLREISDMKCLLLGAGTLGCNVARCLLGWGVKRITFLDNGKVSLSNPARQSLYTFSDTRNGGRPKAQAAAAALKAIHPGLDVQSTDLRIPMPGHAVAASEVESVRKTVEKLEELIAEHDALFLLLDTREARWLPTLLGAKHNKMVLNAALGFDSLLAMRHGTPVNKLGCYFCNDIVGPMNSTKDRTLDQQCTVTRPGVSLMAASFLTELFATLVQHEHGNDAFPDNAFDETGSEAEGEPNVLGLAPHQLRLFLSRLHFMTPSTQAFSMCTACSPAVVGEYGRKGFEFLLRAFNKPDFLEEFTGLKEMQKLADDVDVLALGDSDNDFSM